MSPKFISLVLTAFMLVQCSFGTEPKNPISFPLSAKPWKAVVPEKLVSIDVAGVLQNVVADLKNNSDVQNNDDVVALEKLIEQFSDTRKRMTELLNEAYSPIKLVKNLLDSVSIPEHNSADVSNEESVKKNQLEELKENYDNAIKEFFEEFYHDGFVLWNSLDSKQQLEAKDFYVWFLLVKKETDTDNKYNLLMKVLDSDDDDDKTDDDSNKL